MSLFFYLYLIHFLADYPFQSSKLVEYKIHHFFGVLVHSSVHLLTLLVVLAPFLPNRNVLLVIAVIYITHIIIDQTKVMLNKAYPKYIRFFYFLDQFTHLVVVSACAYYVGKLNPQYLTGTMMNLYSNQSVVLYLLIIVLSTYVYDVSRYFVLGQYKNAFKRDIKTMLINAGIVTVAFGVFWIVGLSL